MLALERAKKLSNKVQIEIGQFTERIKQVPGYLLVSMKRYQLKGDNIQFFGVDRRGALISGNGVEASWIDNYNQEELIAYFNISKLVKQGQFTDQTVEGVITLDNLEVGRKSISKHPAIHLG
ncbi:hypothetical protein Halha_0087 [Halobacteroides halobius DSM 5150]|uniref:Uncharacterized protein n=1 Tax=Halobacteroides halobius (strain ATCC 35273 / DSM 5150 / MD-1) TaxID=748449 RepID=L0K4A0_HALHC|nr:hypothetical protein [Halobacteroides halobius]AGB40107.1 hypothetical protein Halha_0087 [Halobacteroides halobius DSM 5150]